MTREELTSLIAETYGAKPEFPWIKTPQHAVFRHYNNKKWFAIIMNVSGDKLGLKKDNPINIVNFKCDNLLIGSLLKEPGFYPAYHMNKQNWITVTLDGSADDEKIKWLLEMSFDMTDLKIKGKK